MAELVFRKAEVLGELKFLLSKLVDFNPSVCIVEAEICPLIRLHYLQKMGSLIVMSQLPSFSLLDFLEIDAAKGFKFFLFMIDLDEQQS